MKTQMIPTLFGDADLELESGSRAKLSMGKTSWGSRTSYALVNGRSYAVQAILVRNGFKWGIEELIVRMPGGQVPQEQGVSIAVHSELVRSATRWAECNGDVLLRADLERIDRETKGAELDVESLKLKLRQAEEKLAILEASRRRTFSRLMTGKAVVA